MFWNVSAWGTGTRCIKLDSGSFPKVGVGASSVGAVMTNTFQPLILNGTTEFRSHHQKQGVPPKTQASLEIVLQEQGIWAELFVDAGVTTQPGRELRKERM